MSETINGSKSSNYIKEPIPGIDDSSDSLTHQSVQNLWNGRGAADVLIHALYKPSALAMAIEAGSVRRKLVITAHGAVLGDFIKVASGASIGEEVAIVKIVDANTIVIAKEINVSIADSVEVLRAVTPSYNSDGSLNVTILPSTIIYDRKSSGVTVQTNVLEDLDTPSLSRPMPVAIHSIDGAGITVNAGDLSVSINHTNDSVAIGDGTTLCAVTGSNELKVKDTTSNNSLSSIDGKIASKALNVQVVGSDIGVITNSVLHGLTTAGGGSYVDVKVNPSGALTVESTLAASVGTRIGTVAIDQTTPGTTNLVAVSNAFSTEATLLAQSALMGAVTETAPASDTASSGANGRLQRIAQRITSLIALVPASLGSKTAALSFAVTASTEDIARMGIITETAPASDTASSGLNGRLQRVAQRLASLMLLLPVSIGIKADAGSLSVTKSTEDRLLNGSLTETAPASDTASSGLNGRLQRIAQRLTSLIALLPTALGQGTMATSFKVVLPSDQSALPIQSSVGRAKINQAFNDYSITPVTTAAYVQLIASTSAVSNRLEIFDSSGEVLIIAVGAAASEVDQLYVFPGGNGVIDLAIPTASRISIKSKTATASVGLVAINLYS